jgi:integrase
MPRSSKKKHAGIQEVAPGRFVVQVTIGGVRRTTRVNGTHVQAKEAHAKLLTQLLEEQRQDPTSNGGSPGRSSSCPTLAEWLTGRYAAWQERAQCHNTRTKMVSPKRYLLTSHLGDLRLNQIGVAEINAYVEWRLKVGPITFATRKDGTRFRTRQEKVGSQTINKSLKMLSAALRLACDEELIVKVPKITYLPEDDARAIIPPTEEQYRALVREAEQLRQIAPLLPEVIELLGEFGLRVGELFHLPWSSVDWSLGQGENRGALRIEEQGRVRMLGGERWIPKNKKFRTVPFTLRGREVMQKLHAQANPKPDDLVIPNEHGMPYTRLDEADSKGGSNGTWKFLREVSGVAGVSMRDLRHYFAVQNLTRGVPMHVVSSWMGHSNFELTSKRYGRFASDAKEQWNWARLRAQPIEEVAQMPRPVLNVVK